MALEVDKLEKEIRKHDQRAQDLEEVIRELGLGEPSSSILAVFDLQYPLQTWSEALMRFSSALDAGANAALAASRRSVELRRPSRHGNMNDCIVIEEYLELAQILRGNGYNKDIIFISSNTEDYCDDNKHDIHPHLASDFANLQIEFVTNWGHAKHLMGI